MDKIPVDIQQLLARVIESIDQLEALRVLGESGGALWRTADLAVDVQVEPEALPPLLAALEAHGLVTRVAVGAETLWRLGTGTPELQSNVKRLLQVYKERPVTLIRLVYALARGRTGGAGAS